MFATCGLSSLTKAQVLLVTSTARLSVGSRCSVTKSRMALGSTANFPVAHRCSIVRDDVKSSDCLMEIDADESRASTAWAWSGRPGLGRGFWLSFDRTHGDKLHEAFSQGLAPLCEKHVQEAGGPNRHLPLRARSSTGLVVRASDTTAGSRPISVIERPLDDRPLGKALFWLTKKTEKSDRLTRHPVRESIGKSRTALWQKTGIHAEKPQLGGAAGARYKAVGPASKRTWGSRNRTMCSSKYP